MGLSVNVLSGPQTEPVALEGDGGLKQWVRTDEEDTLLTSLLKSARRRVEREYDLALITQTLELRIDRFPRPGNPVLWQQYSWGGWAEAVPTFNLQGSAWPDRAAIFVPRPPLQSVVSIQYVAADGTLTTLDAPQYLVDSARKPARITPAPGSFWPITRVQPDAVIVTYKAGFGDTADSVPDTVKQALKVMVAQAYENREEPGGLSAGVRSLLFSEWCGEVY